MVRSIAIPALLAGVLFAAAASAEVMLNGVTDAQSTNIKAFLALSDLGCDAPEWLVRWQSRQADAQITSSLEALGFYNSRITSELEFPTDACWQARFQIAPGDPVIVRKVAVTVDQPLASETSVATLMQGANRLKDAPLNHADYEDLEARAARGGASAGLLRCVVQGESRNGGRAGVQRDRRTRSGRWSTLRVRRNRSGR